MFKSRRVFTIEFFEYVNVEVYMKQKSAKNLWFFLQLVFGIVVIGVLVSACSLPGSSIYTTATTSATGYAGDHTANNIDASGG